MDASTSIGANNWIYQTQMAANITKYFDVQQNRVRFAAITFNRIPVKEFDLKDYTSQKSLEKALLAIPYPGIEGTRTDLALALITDKNMFGTEAGGRDGIPHLVIVMTDGYATEDKKALEEATKLKVKGTLILTVGISQDISQSELEGMASSKDNVIKATSYSLLDYSMHALVKRTCDNVKTAG
ncbi:collagen alpha-1(XII) chain-like [Physella acuta]|uniref:collagen alpha-1(XII) chain-like n=1 Tax=Physella acuta TaxID=109671 RepID=UPI0027DC3FE1|nr:collagen alpha-1(XII) chain-like [Physella acuta]